MAISAQEKEDTKEILVKIYGSDFLQISPTEHTIELLEALLNEIEKCNKRIQILFKSLHCGAAVLRGKGWLKTCLKAVRDIVSKEPQTFRGCHVVGMATYKSAIYISGI